ncbi:MAG: crossover junction endodeoxyribonuclease RuvC [Planctomycetes bacterium]|nr:crossover junction endodeoxyribonuclease RuvC [Planctomycetota bacterium]
MDGADRILGIDPGTKNVGYGVIERHGSAVFRLASGCIAAPAGSLAERLVAIYRGLREVIGIYSPASAAVETVFTGNNPKTAVAIGEGRGVAVLSAAEHGLSVTGYEPALVKRVVAGNGRAGKEQVRRMVSLLLNLPEIPATDHEADALALAITHARHLDIGGAAGTRRMASRPGSGRRGPLPDFVQRQLDGLAKRTGCLTRI